MTVPATDTSFGHDKLSSCTAVADADAAKAADHAAAAKATAPKTTALDAATAEAASTDATAADKEDPAPLTPILGAPVSPGSGCAKPRLLLLNQRCSS